jgi:ABC-2 type transport system permease protein
MRKLSALVAKELRTYFNSPVAYIVITSYLIFTSVWFFHIQRFAAADTASMRAYFGVVPVLFIVLLPALTMRLWAEEHKMGTAEILVTLPYRDVELVLGKFVSAFAILCVMIALSIPVPVTIAPLGAFDGGQILSEYLGILLLGSAGISIGLFVSSVSRNQISAFLSGAAVLLAFTLIGQAAIVLELSGAASGFVHSISFQQHFESFVKGVLDTRDILYFLVLTVFFLYLNTKTLALRKW